MKVIETTPPRPTRRKSDGALGVQIPMQDERTGDFHWLFFTFDDLGTLAKTISLSAQFDAEDPTQFFNEVP